MKRGETDHRKHVIALREKARVGPKRFQQLVSRFGSPENVYKASREEMLALPRMTPEKVEEILKSQDFFPEIEIHLLYLEEQGIGVCTIMDEGYPQLLRQIDDPPPLLYFRGEFPAKDQLFVAVVGTHRRYTTWGIELAVAIGKSLAERKVVVVSGLAEGIDTAAHVGAISQGGKTYAVLGTGLNKIYPSENVNLAEEISRSGALITEYGLNVPVKVGQLMARNRIAVGLSQAVLIVELDEESGKGTMDAADAAVKQGKPLFVMRKENSKKVEELIADGAVPLEGIDDLDLVVKYL
ncbi:MAG: DNA-processing protein DprA [Candidatus Zixiibacteriota bacterium]